MTPIIAAFMVVKKVILAPFFSHQKGRLIPLILRNPWVKSLSKRDAVVKKSPMDWRKLQMQNMPIMPVISPRAYPISAQVVRIIPQPRFPKDPVPMQVLGVIIWRNGWSVTRLATRIWAPKGRIGLGNPCFRNAIMCFKT